jgi:heat shock protein 5
MTRRPSRWSPKLGTSAAVLCILLIFISPLALLCAAESFDHGIQDPEETGPGKSTNSAISGLSADHSFPHLSVIAIDLGTTRSRVAVVQNGTASILVNTQRRGLLDDAGRFPLGIATSNGSTAGEVDVSKLSETLSALREMAEEHLGIPTRYAVVTVPGDFDESQRQALKDAGRLAGLDVLRQPKRATAACIAYKLDQLLDNRYVIVYHLDDETFNIALLMVESGAMELLASSGDMDIELKAFDGNAMEYMLKPQDGKNNIVTFMDQRAISQSGSETETTKELYSTLTSAHLNVEDTSNRKVVSERSTFDNLNKALFGATWAQVEQVLHDGQVGKHDINDVILTGGSPRLPYVQTQLQELFDGTQIRRGVKPEEVVALGGAIYGDMLIPRDIDYGFCTAVVNPMVGAEFTDGFSAELIRSHRLLPTFTAHNFSVFPNSQGTIAIKICMSPFFPLVESSKLTLLSEAVVAESFRAESISYVGNVNLSGIAPSLSGVSQVEITSYFGRDGMLKVRAVDRRAAVVETITVQDPGYRDLVWDSEAIANSSYGAGGDLRQEYEREMHELEARCYCTKVQTAFPASEQCQKSNNAHFQRNIKSTLAR